MYVNVDTDALWWPKGSKLDVKPGLTNVRVTGPRWQDGAPITETFDHYQWNEMVRGKIVSDKAPE